MSRRKRVIIKREEQVKKNICPRSCHYLMLKVKRQSYQRVAALTNRDVETLNEVIGGFEDQSSQAVADQKTKSATSITGCGQERNKLKCSARTTTGRECDFG